MQKIVYIDSFCNDQMHSQINACLIYALDRIYGENLEIRSSRNGFNAVLKLLQVKSSHYNFTELFVVNANNRFSLLLNYLISGFQNIRLLITSKKRSILFFNYNNPFSIFLLDFLNKFLKRKIIILCHGELEFLTSENPKGLLSRIVSFLIKSYFKVNRRFDDNITFCVLGESIYNNLKNILSDKQIVRFKYFEHPYIYGSYNSNKKITCDGVIKIGTVGTFSSTKGGDDFIYLAKALKGFNLLFSVTGKILDGKDKLKEAGVDLPMNEGSQQLSVEEYQNRVQNLDYLLFLYPRNSYKLTASGALLDAINVERPIIAINNDYFDNFMNLHGKIGYVVEDIESIKEVLIEILNKGDDYKYEFARIKQETSPDSICNVLKYIIDNV